MTVKLANGTEVEAIGVTGGGVRWQGADRDALTFVLDPEKYGLEEVDALFTSENCASITLVDDAGEYVHKGYTLRKHLSLENREVPPALDAEGPQEPKTVREIRVQMAQVSYLEQAVGDLAEVTDALLIDALSALEG